MSAIVFNSGKPARRPANNSSLLLLCFPYAGGNAHIYRSWARSLPAHIEVCPVEIPGRGMLIHEEPYTSLPALAEHLGQELSSFFRPPFAFFGHSMGSLIGFELARYLRRQKKPGPAHLFVSGNTAPQLPREKPPMHHLPHQEFIHALRTLNGTPDEILGNPELMELVIPLLRADFQMVETYPYAAEQPLECPITAFGGFDDLDAEQEELQAWEQQTSAEFSLTMSPGDHFFLRSAQPVLLEKIRASLERPLLVAQ